MKTYQVSSVMYIKLISLCNEFQIPTPFFSLQPNKHEIYVYFASVDAFKKSLPILDVCGIGWGQLAAAGWHVVVGRSSTGILK